MDTEEPRPEGTQRPESYSASSASEESSTYKHYDETENNDKFISSRDAVAPKETPAANPVRAKGFRSLIARFHLPGGQTGKVGQWLRRYWYIVLGILIIAAVLIAWRLYEAHVTALWSKASDDFGRADYQDAAKILNGLPMPSDTHRLTIYSQTMLATRQLDKALTGYQALYDAKKDPSVKLIIGNIYNEQKKYDDAAKAYSDLIAANSGYVQAYVNLATLDKLQGKSDDAVATAKQGVAANPSSATMYELLISMLLEHKDSADYKQAVASLKKLNPQDPIFQTIEQ